ncbi:hypothetical protein ACF0H5_017192 [Mactra antiquata]
MSMYREYITNDQISNGLIKYTSSIKPETTCLCQLTKMETAKYMLSIKMASTGVNHLQKMDD